MDDKNALPVQIDQLLQFGFHGIHLVVFKLRWGTARAPVGTGRENPSTLRTLTQGGNPATISRRSGP